MALLDELAAEHATAVDPFLGLVGMPLPEVPAWMAQGSDSELVSACPCGGTCGALCEQALLSCECGGRCGEICAAEPESRVLPKLPVELQALDDRRPGPVLTGPVALSEQARFAVSELVQGEVFAHHWALAQQQTALMWQAANRMIRAAGPDKLEFVGDDLAMLMGVHPRAGRNVAFTAWAVGQVPGLRELVETAQLSERHVNALLDEAGRWSTGDTAQQVELITQTVERCRQRVDGGHGWPTPGQLRKRLATVAVLNDLSAAEQRKRSVAERRGVQVGPCGVGAGLLTIEGPQVQISQAWEAIEARARLLGALPGDTRSLNQRRYDAALELLTVDADGGESAVPTTGQDGEPVTISVRGIQVSLLTPVSVAKGGDLELAEIPGLGPLLPSTARELLAQAETVQRITVDATTGQVLTVDPPVTVRSDAKDPSGAMTTDLESEAQGEDPVAGRPAEPYVIPPQVQTLVDRVLSEPVVLPDLSSSAYRPPDRLRRMVERRDRTCAFPGCTVPGERCDIDHREPWPHGPTSAENCHCLCRHHHRAKQAYFTVDLDEQGDTVWTTPDGRRYRRPPPAY